MKHECYKCGATERSMYEHADKMECVECIRKERDTLRRELDDALAAKGRLEFEQSDWLSERDTLRRKLEEMKCQIEIVLQLQGEIHPAWNDEYLRRKDVIQIFGF